MPLEPATTEVPEIQLRRACAELNRRVRAGDTVRAEEFLNAFPLLASQADLAVELIYTEFVAREAQGQSASPEECYARFPQWREPLQRLFQVHQLLDAGAEDDVPGTSAAPTGDSGVRAPGNGRVIGHYELIEELGRGGMGVVYKARDRRLNRVVALKMILSGAHAGVGERGRFQTEAEAAARLQHPNIVQIYEVGEADDHHYLAMEFVEGASLAQWLSGKPRPPRKVAELLETLARAMHYAHQQGIVHRDLKPANVLLQIADCKSQIEKKEPQSAICNLQSAIPKITDFGLAKRIGQDAGHTRSGTILGTLSYMAPEQASGEVQRIGPCSDIYALGAILYELLTARPPFGTELSLHTLAQVVTDDPLPPTQLQAGIPRDLETICVKCLQKEPPKRYADAAALADDLQRFLAAEPILARPAGTAERAVKFARRRPALAALIGVSMGAVLCMLLGTLWYNARLRLAVQQADQLRGEAQEHAERLRTQLDTSRRSLYALQLAQVEVLWERDPVRGLELLEDSERCPHDLRDFTWGYFHRLCKRDRLSLADHAAPVLCVAFSPDGKSLAAATGDEQKTGQPGEVKIWDLASGKARAVLRGHRYAVHCVAFSPDGTRLATAACERLSKLPAEVKIWDVSTLQELVNVQNRASWIYAVTFNPQGTLLAIAGADKDVKLWDTASGRMLTSLKGHKSSVTSVTFSPDGKTLVSASESTVKVWDLESGRERATLQGDEARVTKVAFAPDGATLACVGGDRVVVLWDMASSVPRHHLQGHTNRVTSLAFSRDGTILVTGSEDHTVKLWDVVEGREITTLKGHTGRVSSVAFAPDGKSFASAGLDKIVKIWNVAHQQPWAVLQGHAEKVVSVAFTPDGQTLATGCVDGTIMLWDVAAGRLEASLMGRKGAIRSLAFSPDGRTLIAGSEDTTVKLWDMPTRTLRLTLAGHASMVTSVAASSDRRTLASGSHDRTVRIWDSETGAPRTILQGHTLLIRSLAFSPDGKILASASEDETVRLWNTATWQEQDVLKGHARGLNCVAFALTGKTLASGGNDDTIKLWDMESHEERITLKGHTHYVVSVAFSPDGKTLATGSGDRWQNVPGEVKLWDPVTGHVRATLQGHAGPVAFTPDGKMLVTGNADGTVRLWSARIDSELPAAPSEGYPQ